MRLDQVIAQMASRLTEAGFDTARLDARLLACHVLEMSESDLILQFDRPVSDEEQTGLDGVLDRRLAHEPVAHILGEREFWGLSFKVTADTLIPRPDSETLVEGVLDRLSDKDAALTLVDIGTGSGCLLLALLSELPNARGLGIDISEAALEVAKENAQSLGLDQRCNFVIGDYASALDGGMDILISNPPYLAAAEMNDIEKGVADYDPRSALVSGETGLEAYEAIFRSVHSWDQRPFLMAFEIGYRQGASVSALAKAHGLCAKDGARMKILPDLGGRDRVLMLEEQR